MEFAEGIDPVLERTLRQGLQRGRARAAPHLVVVVDVVAEMDHAVAVGPAGHVNPDDRHRLFQIDVDMLLRRDLGEQRGLVPLAIGRAAGAVKQPGRQVVNAFDPDKR